MIINRQHWGWAILVMLASAAATFVYIATFEPARLPFTLPSQFSFLRGEIQTTGRSVGGTPLGIIFGSMAAAIFVFAALLGLRRQRPTLRLGRLQTWLKAHIWLTIFTIPLILLHGGFSIGSPMTQWLLIIYAIVMVSGFYGLALQHFLPRLMKETVPLETIFEQIPHVRAQLLAFAKELRESLEAVPEPAAASPVAAAGATSSEPAPAPVEVSAIDPSSGVLQQFLDEAALPYLSAQRGDRLPLGAQRVSDDQFRLLKISVGPEWQAKAAQLQAWCDERRQLDLQTKLHHWLHAWLLVHVPFSVLLLLFTAWHAVAALFFY